MKKLVPLAALLVATSVSAGDFDTVDVKLSATSNDWTIEHVVDGTDVKVPFQRPLVSKFWALDSPRLLVGRKVEFGLLMLKLHILCLVLI